MLAPPRDDIQVRTRAWMNGAQNYELFKGGRGWPTLARDCGSHPYWVERMCRDYAERRELPWPPRPGVKNRYKNVTPRRKETQKPPSLNISKSTMNKLIYHYNAKFDLDWMARQFGLPKAEMLRAIKAALAA